MDRTRALAVLENGTLTGVSFSEPVPWWSFTKTVLAAAALRLVARGILTLDDPVAPGTYTLRQLSRHTAGLGNYTQLDAYVTAVRAGDPPWPPGDMLRRVSNSPPGTLWAYSNTSYYIVRTIIEKATGLSLSQALDNLIFSPLGVTGVIVGETPADLQNSLWGNPTGYDPRWVYHGLLIGSASAAVRTLYGILKGGLLPDLLVTDMCHQIPLGTEILGRPGRDFGYGMGLMIARDGPAGPMLGHTGHDTTSVAAVYHFPEKGRTVAAFLPGDREAEVEWAATLSMPPPAIEARP